MISIDWPNGVISVPQSFLTLVSGTTYSLDVNVLRLALKDLEDDEAGMAWPTTHDHVPVKTLGGVTFARTFELINGYTLVFEDAQYGVNLYGANHNIPDVLVRNQVSVASANSAGLVVAGSALTTEEATQLQEVHRRFGLDMTSPLVITPTSIKVPGDGSLLDQTIDDVAGVVTVTRQ